MLFNLNRNIKASLLVVTILSLFILSLAGSFSYIPKPESNTRDQIEQPNTISKVKLSSRLSNPRIEKVDSPESSYSPKTITPTTIIRGNSFVSSGRLEDPDTGTGYAGMTIQVFWSTFSWAAYEVDPDGFYDTYGVGTGTTNSDGNFAITCRDVDYSLDYGVVTVYTVFPGDYRLGPIEDNRQYTSEDVDCYASLFLGFNPDQQDTVREGESFYAVTGLLYYDNDITLVPESIGQDITYDWLGSTYTDTIISFISNITLNVPLGTSLTNHALDASFNMSVLGLSYVVGDITDEALIGTPAADWTNASINIEVFSGAGISLTIDDPISPGIGENPTILREETDVTISGVIEDDTGTPYAFAVDLEIFVDQGTSETSTTLQATTIAASGTGIFSATFNVSGTYLPVGDCNVWANVADGQGITATVDYEVLTVEGNSSIVNTEVNNTSVLTETFMVMPGENVEVSGIMRDVYDSRGIQGMVVSAQWEGTGPSYDDNTTATGAFTIILPVPLTYTAADSEGTITIQTSETIYYNSSSTNFTVDIFTTVNFDVQINNTNVIEDAGYNSLDGNPLYNNSTFTLQANLTDQFTRPLEDKTVNVTIESYGSSIRTLSSTGGFSYTFPGDDTLLTSVDYIVTITFKENIEFSFRIRFQVYPTPTDTGVSSPTSPTIGGDNLGPVLIGILIAMVSGIIIVSTVYAFGRFRKSKKRPGPAGEVARFDLSTILKQIDESEKAKDYKRGAVLCYRAFEAICGTHFGVIDARSQSPRELARIIASTNRVPVRDVTMLVMRYEEARYSNHKITKNSYTQARQALHNLQLAIEKPSTNPGQG